MLKIRDIKGYWKKFDSENYNETDMWEGKILVEGDGWFEGIVVDPHSSYYTGYRFVFGVYHEDKVIELLKMSPPDTCITPFVFRVDKNDEKYDGVISVIDWFGEDLYGECRIFTKTLEVGKEEGEVEVSLLQNKIRNWKKSMDYTDRDFYQNIYAIRNSMTEIILRNHEGRKFTQEESESIMEECQPINYRVAESQREDIKRLVKEKDLPF